MTNFDCMIVFTLIALSGHSEKPAPKKKDIYPNYSKTRYPKYEYIKNSKI